MLVHNLGFFIAGKAGGRPDGHCPTIRFLYQYFTQGNKSRNLETTYGARQRSNNRKPVPVNQIAYMTGQQHSFIGHPVQSAVADII